MTDKATSAILEGLASSQPLRGWAQDEDGSWWYHTGPRASRSEKGVKRQRQGFHRTRGGFRRCVECGDSYLSVHSRKSSFCSKACSCRDSNKRRALTPGSTFLNKQGYVIEIVASGDPLFGMGRKGNKNGRRLLQHRLVVARALGRPLLETETVHHINGDRADNRLENLQLMSSGHPAGQVARCADCGSAHITFEEVSS